MTEEEELQHFLRVDPKVLQTLLQFKTYKEMQKLRRELSAHSAYWGPMQRGFGDKYVYQYKTIGAGANGTVWVMENPEPDNLVGIITQVANSWFENTHLDWFIDYEPRRIDYVLGAIGAPKYYERGIPFFKKLEWVAYNNDVANHVFEVLCDGFFIPREIYRKLVK